MMKRRAATLTLLCAMLAAGPARADEASAAETFRAGKAAYARGEYRAAALSFEAAFREQPHGAALYNAGQSWLAAGALPRAADAYSAALRAGGLDAAQEADARVHLTELETSLGTITVTAPPGALISLEHVERAPAPATVHVTAGEHSARADLPDGRSVNKPLRAAAGERLTLAIEGPPAQSAAPLGQSSAAPVAGGAEPRSGPSGRQIAGMSSLGAGVIAGGLAIGLGVTALDARDAFDASQHTDRDARERAANFQALTNVSWVAAGTLSALGVVLLVTSIRPSPASSGVKTTVRMLPGGAVLSGSF